MKGRPVGIAAASVSKRLWVFPRDGDPKEVDGPIVVCCPECGDTVAEVLLVHDQVRLEVDCGFIYNEGRLLAVRRRPPDHLGVRGHPVRDMPSEERPRGWRFSPGSPGGPVRGEPIRPDGAVGKENEGHDRGPSTVSGEE